MLCSIKSLRISSKRLLAPTIPPILREYFSLASQQPGFTRRTATASSFALVNPSVLTMPAKPARCRERIPYRLVSRTEHLLRIIARPPCSPLSFRVTPSRQDRLSRHRLCHSRLCSPIEHGLFVNSNISYTILSRSITGG